MIHWSELNTAKKIAVEKTRVSQKLKETREEISQIEHASSARRLERAADRLRTCFEIA